MSLSPPTANKGNTGEPTAGASPEQRSLSERILDALPQTQCTRCGYIDCASYAHAITNGQAAINQCPPGGAEGVDRLARITGQAIQPLNPDNGLEGPRAVAWIDENWCIGCTLCIKACPIDCIVGSNKLMHTVIEAECTGCELCVAACAVDCIHMENVTGTRTGWDAWSAVDADLARQRYDATQERRAESNDKTTLSTLKTRSPTRTAANLSNSKQDIIAAALARARTQRGERS